MDDPRSRHEIFETDFDHSCSWKNWWAKQWLRHLEFYERKNWRMIPIRVRSKFPLTAHENYESHAAHGPYLSLEEAQYWTGKDFNLAVAASPSGLVWADVDRPELFQESLLKGLIMRTPRGFTMPLKLDFEYTDEHVTALKEKGYDFRDGLMYSCVPLSETCIMDSSEGVRHVEVGNSCVNGGVHQFRIREFVDMKKPILHFKDFLEAVK